MATLEEIRARERDPATFLASRATADLIHDRVDHAAQLRIAEQARKARSTTAKIYLLRDLSNELAKATEGLVPCKAGCNHCCKMATAVSMQEAKLIAKETGLKLHTPKRYNDFRNMRVAYDGVPCSMLKDGVCSIYASRPFACRVHYVVDRDNLLCEIHPGVSIRAPHLAITDYDMLYVQAMADGQPQDMLYADIREFFPKA